MLILENITFAYAAAPILDTINLQLKQGTVAAIIGESGCGKSTLLDLVYGLLQEKSGHISFNSEQLTGADFHLVPGHEMMKYVPQEFNLMPFTSVFENVGEHVSLQNDHRKSIILKMLEIVGMQDFKDRKVKTLSGGQKQRVAIAKALAQQPKVLLMDEPFSNIDNFRKNELRRSLFTYFKENNISCLIATHDKDDVLAFTDRTIIMQHGKIIDDRATSDVYKHPKSFYGASLFDDVNEIPAGLLGNKEALLSYPHQVVVANTGVSGIVKSFYFVGSYYLLLVKVSSQLLFVRHDTAIPLQTSCFLQLSSLI